jgi:AraC-like DNA-binding protein
MEEACSLLSGTRANIVDISESLGFTNRSHFYSIFKTHYGMTPAEFRTIKKGN